MSQNYKQVHITSLFDRTFHYLCDNEEGYMKHLKKNPDMVELIGGFKQQIKPVFDIDDYNNIDINLFINDLCTVFPNKKINWGMRNARQYKDKGIKYSYRVYVDGVRMTSKNIETLIGTTEMFRKYENMIDTSIYDKNKVLFLPLTTKKRDNEIHPPLNPINCSIFDCCASYIKEDFEDWDKHFDKPVDVNSPKEEIDIEVDDIEDDSTDKYDRVARCINKLSQKRSDDFKTWIDVCWAIINIGNKEGIRQSKIEKLIHDFSKKSQNYHENKVDEWIDKNIDKVREKSYGWNFLYNTCIKEDDPVYFNSLTKGYLTLKKEFEKYNAKILYPPVIIHYKNNNEYIIQNMKNCKETNNHIKCSIKEVNKQGKTIYKDKKFIDMWLDDPKIRKYDNVVFKPPPEIADYNEFNTWINFNVSSTPLVQTDRDYWKEYYEYAINLLGKKEYADFVLARYAYRLQKPAKRTYVCCIYYGQERTGKNKLLEPIYKIFENYTECLDSAKKLYDTHSMYEKDKLLILINEAGGTANFENADILKTRITEPTLCINPKGIQSYKIDNRCDYDMTTNNMNVVKLTDDSVSRWFQVETTSYYKGNTNFFQDFSNNIVNNPIALRQIYEGLMNFNVSEVIPTGNFQNDKPRTEIEEVVKQQNRDKILWFIEDLITDVDDELLEFGFIKYSNKELFTLWNNWCDRYKVKLEYNGISFGIKITNLMKNKLNINGKVCVKKDTKHSTTTLFIQPLKEFFDMLNGV